jgi:hypothetical protein
VVAAKMLDVGRAVLNFYFLFFSILHNPAQRPYILRRQRPAGADG